MIVSFNNCRNIPKDPMDRALGEGDRCARDKENRICAWNVGYSDEDWNDLLKRNPDWHESVAYYDVVRGGLI